MIEGPLPKAICLKHGVPRGGNRFRGAFKKHVKTLLIFKISWHRLNSLQFARIKITIRRQRCRKNRCSEKSCKIMILQNEAFGNVASTWPFTNRFKTNIKSNILPKRPLDGPKCCAAKNAFCIKTCLSCISKNHLSEL